MHGLKRVEIYAHRTEILPGKEDISLNVHDGDVTGFCIEQRCFGFEPSHQHDVLTTGNEFFYASEPCVIRLF